MRKDFAKMLVERYRLGAGTAIRYGDMRSSLNSARSDELLPARQSMRSPYNKGYNRKEFNEFLQPLEGWIRTCAGRKWDDCYGELRRIFDARGVINSHILDHLWSYISIHTFMIGDQVWCRRRGFDRERPAENSTAIAYVHPVDGTVCLVPSKPSWRRLARERKEAELARVERYLDRRHVLRLIDDNWFWFELRPLPTCKPRYLPQEGVSRNHQYNVTPFSPYPTLKTWDDMDQAEQRCYGQLRPDPAAGRKDLFLGFVVYAMKEHWPIYTRGPVWEFPLYHAVKRTASYAQLRQAGIR